MLFKTVITVIILQNSTALQPHLGAWFNVPGAPKELGARRIIVCLILPIFLRGL